MLVARVRRTIAERDLIPQGARVLAACSGGPDSAAMLVALARLREELDFELLAASVDHGLRATSAADVEVARQQAELVGVPFHALRVQVGTGNSVQDAAREARYAALLRLAADLGAARVAVGHTQHDQAETVLLRLLRGAGVAGLSSIEPRRHDGVIRPLIDCARSDVLAFATQHCPALAHDPSNEDPRFTRVRVRGELLPLLEREDPAVVAHLAELSDDAREVSFVVTQSALALLEGSLQGDETVDVSTWVGVPPAVLRTALRAWLEPRIGAPLGRAHLEQLAHALRAPAEIWLPGGFSVHRAGDAKLRLCRTTEHGA